MAEKTKETVTVENGGEAPKTYGGEPANLAATTEFDPSGAPRQVVGDVDPSHPAVDDNPRAGTTVAQNAIDFNDPTISGAEAVKRNIDAQAGSDSGEDVTEKASG